MKADEWLLGDITEYDGAYMTIRVKYTDVATFIRREYHEVEVRPKDSRPLSDKQRRSCYAMIREISEWMGEDTTETKEFMKYEFMAGEMLEMADSFSLANAPMSLVAGFQSFLARFIVRNDIPTKISMLDYVDDIDDFVYACLASKKCCICGKSADLHHCTTVGSQGARDTLNHIGQIVLPLCREHHQEAHLKGLETFETFHHVHGVPADKTICKLYKLNMKEKRQ